MWLKNLENIVHNWYNPRWILKDEESLDQKLVWCLKVQNAKHFLELVQTILALILWPHFYMWPYGHDTSEKFWPVPTGNLKTACVCWGFYLFGSSPSSPTCFHSELVRKVWWKRVYSEKVRYNCQWIHYHNNYW